ncbi:MAG: PrgI family protein [Candidatus Azambacteria bacterium]|nr:PrgI family protein [Candidatus Azambacteria bacterium]
MQYQVPQFVDIEDRIIGPLTLKQFLYLAFGGAILFVTWFVFKFFIWIIIAIPVVAVASAFAFIKINDRPFVYFFLSFINYYLKPKLYIFSTVPIAPQPITLPEKPSESSSAPQSGATEDKKITRSKLKELALSLDTGAQRL